MGKTKPITAREVELLQKALEVGNNYAGGRLQVESWEETEKKMFGAWDRQFMSMEKIENLIANGYTDDQLLELRPAGHDPIQFLRIIAKIRLKNSTEIGKILYELS